MDNIAQRVRSHGTPLIDGQTVTFVWLGKKAPLLRGDFSDWERAEPVKLKRTAPNVWTHSIDLPTDAYMEYAFFEGEERVSDPFNPLTSPNGIGDKNHFFYMPQYQLTKLAKHRRGVPRGTVTRLMVDAESLVASGRRAVYLYQPPVEHPCPLLVIWDGYDYYRRSALPTIVDNLIADRQISPIAMAMVQNGGNARMIEYACSESQIIFLQYCLLPLAERQLNLIDCHASPGSFGILGASMGGLMAIYTALRLPHIFGKVLSQSGSFNLGDYESVVYDLVRYTTPQINHIWMEAGAFDFKDILPANRSMYSLLRSRGYSVFYREYPAGHNYPAWRNEVWRGLEYLFPPEHRI